MNAGGGGCTCAYGFGARNGSQVLSAVALAVGAGRTGATNTSSSPGRVQAAAASGAARVRVGDSKHLVRGWSAPWVHASCNLLTCLALSCKVARRAEEAVVTVDLTAAGHLLARPSRARQHMHAAPSRPLLHPTGRSGLGTRARVHATRAASVAAGARTLGQQQQAHAPLQGRTGLPAQAAAITLQGACQRLGAGP